MAPPPPIYRPWYRPLAVSAFGLVSTIVASLSIYTLILHHRLTKRRIAVDSALATILDILYEDEDAEISQEIQSHDQAVDQHNAFLAKPHGRFIASLVGMEKEGNYANKSSI